MPKNASEATASTPGAKKYSLKHWRFLPVFEIMLFVGAVAYEDLGEVPESAWADFPHNDIDKHVHNPALALAALFWEQDHSRLPKSGLMVDVPALMKIINRENRVFAISRSFLQLRVLPASTKSDIKNVVTRHFQIKETSTFSDISALWALRNAFSWPSPLAVELAFNKDEANSDINSERFSKALAAAISVMAWASAANQTEALAFYKRASARIPKWQAPDQNDFIDIKPWLLYQAIEFISVVASLDIKKKLLAAVTEIAMEDKKISQDEFECLGIFYNSLAMPK